MSSDAILIVDDDPTIERMLTYMLNNAGYDTVTAVDGKDALAKVQKLEPRLVFLDVMLPEKDGYQVCEEIRSNANLSRQPYIIMLTARGRETDVEQAKVVGVDEYVTKPFSPSKIIARVKEILG
jgi:DNA-binding response OmpR family regulator